MEAILYSVLGFAFVIGVSVIIHEFGHFAVAKMFKVKVAAFSIGFGPAILKFRTKETEYRLGILPLGGYVQFQDDKQKNDDEPIDESRLFQSKPIWQRALIAFAGPAINIILAFLVVTGVFWFKYEYPSFFDREPVVGYVLDGHSAKKAGIQKGDRIVAVDGKNIQNWKQFINLILISGEKVNLTVRSDQASVNNVKLSASIEEKKMNLGIFPVEAVSVQEVIKNSPAEKAGIQKEDVIFSANGTQIYSRAEFSEMVQKSEGKELSVLVSRININDGFYKARGLKIKPEFNKQNNRWMIGILFSQQITKKQLSLLGAAGLSASKNAEDSLLILEVLKRMVTGKADVKNTVGGPIAIAQASGTVAQRGIIPLLMFLALMNINLAIFNLLPIPVLDGSLLLLLAVEKVRGKKLEERTAAAIQAFGFLLLIILMVVMLFLDLSKIF